MANQYPPIGTVSEATMRNEDLIPAFADILERYAPESYATLRAEFADTFAELESDDFEDFEDQWAAAYLTDALFEALDAIAAPYTYFGSTEGDGSDYGFWPDVESLEGDARYGAGVLKVNDGADWGPFHNDGYFPSYVMSVSDHGNVTLYDARTRVEIWSIV